VEVEGTALVTTSSVFVAFDTNGEVIFAAASTLTHQVFNGMPNMNRAYSDFASSLHDRRSPPRMKMWENFGCAAGPEGVFDRGAPSLPSRRPRSPCRHRPLSPLSTHVRI
jgi:hypothetical protein